MELLEQLELVEVTYDNKKAVLTFLDEERGEIRDVAFNKQVYNAEAGAFEDDAEKAEKVEQWCEEFFGLTFDTLTQAVGTRKDVYAYERFNSLYPVSVVDKFEKDDVGQIMQVEITDVQDSGTAIVISLGYEGKTYQSKMTYADYLEARKMWAVNPQKKLKQFEKFEQKFGVSVDNKHLLIGQNVMIEVKLAFSKFVFLDIKPLKKKW